MVWYTAQGWLVAQSLKHLSHDPVVVSSSPTQVQMCFQNLHITPPAENGDLVLARDEQDHVLAVPQLAH